MDWMEEKVILEKRDDDKEDTLYSSKEEDF